MLGDGCREPSSAHWSSALPATNPAECIWQQYARQQIAATCRRACRRAYYREQAARLPAAAHTAVALPPGIPPCMLPKPTAVALPPRNYRKKLPPCATVGTPTPRTTYLPCMLPQPAAKTYLPLIPPCIPPCIPPWRYRRGATAEALPQKTTVVCYRRGTTAVHAAGNTTARWVPCPAGG